ncbi:MULTISPECIES: hypothetical protein [Haloferacaceae]|uniref:Uncharacterized protein n=1 Tax=Halorubrum glutamatedens TaxID=2707018 RepID=A0ABD5QRA2_9EURY|nr:hypothetical protein [Halobellus captivus]
MTLSENRTTLACRRSTLRDLRSLKRGGICYDEPVETRQGSIDGGADCGGFTGSEYEFTHTFADPGEYALTGEIVVEGSPGAGDREPIGTVAVG